MAIYTIPGDTNTGYIVYDDGRSMAEVAEEEARKQAYQNAVAQANEWAARHAPQYIEPSKPVIRHKEYPTTLRGFMSALYDKATHNDTYTVYPEENAIFTQDNRNALERYANQPGNPLYYLWQNVVPAAEVAGTAVGVGEMVTPTIEGAAKLTRIARNKAPQITGNSFSEVGSPSNVITAEDLFTSPEIGSNPIIQPDGSVAIDISPEIGTDISNPTGISNPLVVAFPSTLNDYEYMKKANWWFWKNKRVNKTPKNETPENETPENENTAKEYTKWSDVWKQWGLSFRNSMAEHPGRWIGGTLVGVPTTLAAFYMWGPWAKYGVQQMPKAREKSIKKTSELQNPKSKLENITAQSPTGEQMVGKVVVDQNGNVDWDSIYNAKIVSQGDTTGLYGTPINWVGANVAGDTIPVTYKDLFMRPDKVSPYISPKYHSGFQNTIYKLKDSRNKSWIYYNNKYYSPTDTIPGRSETFENVYDRQQQIANSSDDNDIKITVDE